MNSQLVEADERLATVFSHFYSVQLDKSEPAIQQQLLPNYELLLIVNFGPDVPFSLGDNHHTIHQTAVLGPLQKMLTYTLPPGADVIVVNFTLNGFYRLLGVPMQQLKPGELYDPDILLDKSCFQDLWSQLSGMQKQEDRLELLTDYALTFVKPSEAGALSLLDSVNYFKNLALDPVKLLAQTNQVSTRRIQTHFQTYLGYSAKELSRFLRFKKVLHFLYQQPPTTIDWHDLVLTFGYYDHSHLIKDFTYFLGISPRKFLKQIATGGVCISKSGKFY
ncbi:AraC family transcriptional regulator [Spirosoma sp. KCTC 42546]|uniref:AraC family transcriptional regulator n=1 Tax=Spirosoma sp. KCTC 42546 TaxID=2520506 RepID=UPI00115B79DA|nr:helix-turn-helix domain-containing protein [Spirosoma sp. KCTC 42546]QDK79832.1 AraC family transcriptional regulator [Spirosoma sp. KCTC 42546]